jgi:hypothetical protein
MTELTDAMMREVCFENSSDVSAPTVVSIAAASVIGTS